MHNTPLRLQVPVQTTHAALPSPAASLCASGKPCMPSCAAPDAAAAAAGYASCRFSKSDVVTCPVYRLRYQRAHSSTTPSPPSAAAPPPCLQPCTKMVLAGGEFAYRPPVLPLAHACCFCAPLHADRAGTDPFPYPPASCRPPRPRASGGQSLAPWFWRSSPCVPSFARSSSVE